ncbi:MAG: hypothetical protein ACOYOA_03740 [Saprospiraceae bacterium]
MKGFKNICIIFHLLVSSTILSAQNVDPNDLKYIDIIKLKDGSVFQGKINKLTDQTIEMEILGGAKANFSRTDIMKIEQRCLNCGQAVRVEGSSITKVKSFYHHIAVGSISSSSILPGGNLTWSSGYQIYPRMGVGAGIGVQSYGDYQNSFDPYPKAIPFFAETKLYLKDSRHSPYFDLKGGYSITPFHSEAKGGYFFFPSVGTKFGKLENSSFTVNFGMLVQKMSYHFDSQNSDYQITDRNLILRRWTLQVGMLF